MPELNLLPLWKMGSHTTLLCRRGLRAWFLALKKVFPKGNCVFGRMGSDKFYVAAGLNIVPIAIVVIGVLRSTEGFPIAIVPDFDSSVHIAELDSGSAAAQLAT